ncbi:MAG: phosphoglycerate mutase family protein [Anaerolineae bacterium]|nr:phosphoglycerate mutase family protein [Anaerolineae bacterium]
MTDLQLYLVRHGQSVPSLKSNPGLTEQGRQQAALLAGWFKKNVVCKAIFTSDMRRALETAEVLDQHLPISIQEDVRLREYMGWDAEGQPYDLAFPPEQHETWAHFVARVKGCLQDSAVAYQGQSIVWVAHGGLFDVMIATVLKLGASHTATTFIHHTGISHFRYADGKVNLVFHNQTDHLPDHLKTY